MAQRKRGRETFEEVRTYRSPSVVYQTLTRICRARLPARTTWVWFPKMLSVTSHDDLLTSSLNRQHAISVVSRKCGVARNVLSAPTARGSAQSATGLATARSRIKPYGCKSRETQDDIPTCTAAMWRHERTLTEKVQKPIYIRPWRPTGAAGKRR